MSHVFYLPNIGECGVGDVVVIDGDEGHHAVRVRRIAVAEEIEIVDGVGTRVAGIVREVGKASCTVEVLTVTAEPQPTPQVTVVQALVKKDRSDQVIELLTESGVDRIIAWRAQRSQMRETPAKWDRLVVESSKQSRRARFPVVEPARDTADVIELVSERADRAVVLVCHESREARSITDVLRELPDADEYIIVIGPEGGLTDEETDAFAAAGAHTVWLGPTVMRAATAGAIAAAIVSAQTSRWTSVGHREEQS